MTFTGRTQAAQLISTSISKCRSNPKLYQQLAKAADITDELADEFGRIAKDLVDPNEQKIFRYNRRTHNIELADGAD